MSPCRAEDPFKTLQIFPTPNHWTVVYFKSTQFLLCAFVLSDTHTTARPEIELASAGVLRANHECVVEREKKDIGQDKWANWLIKDKLVPNGKRQQNAVCEGGRGGWGSSKMWLSGHICPCLFNMPYRCVNCHAGAPAFWLCGAIFSQNSTIKLNHTAWKMAQWTVKIRTTYNTG